MIGGKFVVDDKLDYEMIKEYKLMIIVMDGRRISLLLVSVIIKVS